MESQVGKHKLILSTSKTCINEKKLRFILSDCSVIRESNQAWFELFSKTFLTFQFNVGCILPSVWLWHIFRPLIKAPLDPWARDLKFDMEVAFNMQFLKV